MTDAPGTLLSLGHGYSAQALAVRLLPRGWRVIGTTRSPDKARALAAAGVEALVWEPGSPGADSALAGALVRATHLLSSIAPGPTGDPVLGAHRAALAAARHLGWVGYLSTTGVYGDRQGAWVDEDTPTDGATPRGRARVLAEADWRAVCADAGVPLHIFRLAGIYGPGRGPFEKVRTGTARRIVKPGQVFSRIHVADIAQVLDASIARRAEGALPQGGIWNVCDDDPAPPQDVIGHAARLLGLPQPPEIPFRDANLGPMARSFYAESKRVRNDRMKRDLGVQLIHPDYRSGLSALLAEEGG